MRQRRVAAAYTQALKDVKARYGSGLYSWAGEMTRRGARRIARVWAREAAKR